MPPVTPAITSHLRNVRTNCHMVRASRSASFFISSTVMVSFLRRICAILAHTQVLYNRICRNSTAILDFFRGIGYNHPCVRETHSWIGIEVVITALTRNFWKLRPFRPLKMSAAQGFARVRISQFHIVLACFSCILPEQGLHLRYTESCPRGRRCDTRNVVFPKGT